MDFTSYAEDVSEFIADIESKDVSTTLTMAGKLVADGTNLFAMVKSGQVKGDIGTLISACAALESCLNKHKVFGAGVVGWVPGMWIGIIGSLIPVIQSIINSFNPPAKP